MVTRQNVTSPDGNLPADWTQAPLFTVADARFSSVDKVVRANETEIRLCNYVDVYKNEYITGSLRFMRGSATPEEIDRFRLRIGDVIITKDSETPNDIAIAAVVDYEAADLVCGYHLGLLRTDTELVDPTFLAKQLGHHRLSRYFGSQANGLTRYGLPLSSIRNTPLWLPRMDEQVIIGRIARLLDAAIAQSSAAVVKYEQVRAGVLHDLLTRGIDEQGRLRPCAADAPEIYKDSLAGKVPVGWDVPLLDEIAIRGSGHTPAKDVPSYWNGGVKWVSLADSERLDRIYISETDKEISHLGLANSSAVLHPAGTVVLSRDAGVGKSAILATNMAVSQHFIAWKCGRRLRNLYLYYWLQHNKRQFEAIAMGSTIKTIGLPYFKRLRVATPPICEQDACCKVLLVVEDLLSTQREAHLKLKMLRRGVMSDLLTGTVRVLEYLKTEIGP
jgi:type I restriction enzyme S subunit